jgi:hypothetical protein
MLLSPGFYLLCVLIQPVKHSTTEAFIGYLYTGVNIGITEQSRSVQGFAEYWPNG